MEIRSFGTESSSHVAQQSRRDKLRTHQRLQDFSDNLDQQLQPSLVHDQVRNFIRSGNNGNVFQFTSISNVFSTYEIVNFASNSNSNNDDQELGGSSVQPYRLVVEAGQDSSFAMSHPILSNFTSSPKSSATINHDPQGSCENWRSHEGSHQTSCDWMMNYGSTGGGGVVMSSDTRVISNGSYQDVHVQSVRLANHLSEVSGHDKHKLYRDMQFGSHHNPIYHNNLLDVGSTSFGCNDQRSNLFPYGNQSSVAAALQFDTNANAWINRPVENNHQWICELGFIERKSDHELRPIASCDPNSQSLSLSLSSNPSSDVNAVQFGEGYESEYLHSKTGGAALKEDMRVEKSSSHMSLIEKPSIISRNSGKSLQDIVGSSACAFRSTGPLGPFTGYATILKSSRFMKPAQELLEELCNATYSKILTSNCEMSDRVSDDQASVSALDDVVNHMDVERRKHDSSMSSSSYSFNKGGNGDGRDGSGSSCEPYKPEYRQKKAKLVYMQEEVWRRYKQYHQQMQMVASSFESVAGLSAATPYLSLLLKKVSRNFRCLRNAISDQLKHVTKALGEDSLLTNAIASGSRGDTSTSTFRYMDQSFQKLKCGGANAGFFEPQQQFYRPQRGLPERSVAILRAWLFDHFLHPYPTDTDKHMLATQTGLSRSQVSNWFINARVRVWKPMIEEMHTLETKGLVETNRKSTKNDVTSAEGTSKPTGSAEQMDEEQWILERKSNEEFQVPTGTDGSLLNFLPYQRNTIDVGGLRAVSLTLGLRHGVENASQQHKQQQFQQHEDQLRRQYGQMIYDFVG